MRGEHKSLPAFMECDSFCWASQDRHTLDTHKQSNRVSPFCYWMKITFGFVFFLFERHPHFDLIGLDSLLAVLLLLFFCLIVCLLACFVCVILFVHFDLFYFSSAENVINWDYRGDGRDAHREQCVCIAWVRKMIVTAVTWRTFVGMDDDTMHAKLCHCTFKHPQHTHSIVSDLPTVALTNAHRWWTAHSKQRSS